MVLLIIHLFFKNGASSLKSLMALKCGCFHLINNGFLDQMVQNLKKGRGMGGVIYAFHEQ